jgi:hypothetical protein
MSSFLINPFISFPTNVGGATDPDAAAYIAAVEEEDGDVLEAGVVTAIDNFVIGCKADGIWSAIKASCIMAGARTLDGALVPLVGPAPTNFNFVAGDYNRRTGLVGNGSTKYLDSNRNNNADPRDSKHLSAYATDLPAADYGTIIGTGQSFGDSMVSYGWDAVINRLNCWANSNTFSFEVVTIAAPVFLGVNRSIASSATRRRNGANTTLAVISAVPLNRSITIYKLQSIAIYYPCRLSFYSIGESLDLALLDARVSTLMTDIAAAIP